MEKNNDWETTKGFNWEITCTLTDTTFSLRGLVKWEENMTCFIVLHDENERADCKLIFLLFCTV